MFLAKIRVFLKKNRNISLRRFFGSVFTPKASRKRSVKTHSIDVKMEILKFAGIWINLILIKKNFFLILIKNKILLKNFANFKSLDFSFLPQCGVVA